MDDDHSTTSSSSSSSNTPPPATSLSTPVSRPPPPKFSTHLFTPQLSSNSMDSSLLGGHGDGISSSSTVSMKRSRAEIATPQKPGSQALRLQEQMSFIGTPGRAPSAAKMAKMARSQSPTPLSAGNAGEEEEEGERMLVLGTGLLSMSEEESSMVRFSDDDEEEDMGDEGEVTLRLSLPVLELRPKKDKGQGMRVGLDMEVDSEDDVEDVDEDEDARVFGVRGRSVSDLDNADATVVAGLSFSEDSEIEFGAGPDSGNAVAGVFRDASTEEEEERPVPSVAEPKPEPVPVPVTVTEPEPMAEPELETESEPVAETVTESETIADPEPVAEPGPVIEPELATEAGKGKEVEHESTDYEMASADTEDAAAEAASMDVTSPEPAPAPAPGPELVSARILSDPELMYAASIPLPDTPAVAADQSTPKRAAPGDFYIPADWLMNPNSETQQQRHQRVSQQPESPLQRFSATPSVDHPHSGNLIPVTPANQKLLDSLEIQWVSPRLVAKFSEADMEAERLSFDEKLGQRDELHRMIMESVKEEFAAQMRQAEQAAEDAAQRARDLAQRQMEQVQREHEAALRAQRAQHREEIQRRDEDTRSQVAELSREIENALVERMALVEDRDATQATLEQLMAVSTALEEEKTQHIHGLEQELGSLTVERRRLLQQLAEALTAAEELSAERDDVVKRVEALTLENVRMEELANALGSDVLVAEERSTKIKEYAESTLAAANAEIASAHDQLGALRHEVGLLRTQNAKAENRARSLQIQLDSTKRQNEELVAHYNSM